MAEQDETDAPVVGSAVVGAPTPPDPATEETAGRRGHGGRPPGNAPDLDPAAAIEAMHAEYVSHLESQRQFAEFFNGTERVAEIDAELEACAPDSSSS